jgi:hypothetical protein
MDRASIDVIVAVLVEDLMTNGAQQRAERLKLVASDGRDLGGWSARALQERIRRHFEPFEDPPSAQLLRDREALFRRHDHDDGDIDDWRKI